MYILLCRKYGDVVEDLEIVKTYGIHAEPESGHLILKNVLAMQMILKGQEKVKFYINGRQLWARQYDPLKPPQKSNKHAKH